MKNIFIALFVCFGLFVNAQQWVEVTSPPSSILADHTFGFSLEGKGYLVSGSNGLGFNAEFHEYDPIADAWSQKDDFPGGARGFAIGDIHDGKAYFGFGTDNSDLRNDLWEYDPIEDQWTELASCPCDARTHPAMISVDGEIFVGMGGGAGVNRNDWWSYSIMDNSWTQMPDFPSEPRHHPYQFTDGRYVYTGFGHGSGFISDEWFRFDPVNDTWDQMSNIPSEGRVAGTQFSHNGFGYILSGDGDNHGFMDTGEFWQYDPQINSWNQLEPHPGISRWAPASFIIGEEIYIIGGLDNQLGYNTPTYKADLSLINQASLRVLVPELDNKQSTNYDATIDQCDGIKYGELSIYTAIPFEFDVPVSVSINDNSTAVEGVDFILETKEAILPSGENSVQLEIIYVDDLVVNGDKVIVVDLQSDEAIAVGQAIILIKENDKVIEYDSGIEDANIGSVDGSSGSILRGYYTHGRTQMLFRKELLNEFGFYSGSLDNLILNIESINSTLVYRNFTLSIAHTDQESISEIDLTADFVEVYKENLTVSLGENRIDFDTDFEYDGVSNLLIEVCFGNSAFSESDLVRTFEVDYDSFISVFDDFASGCISDGNRETGQILPYITFGNAKSKTLYDRIGDVTTGSIDQGDVIYFQENDSILGAANYLEGNETICFSQSLISSGEGVTEVDGVQFFDRRYFLSSDAQNGETLEATMLYPFTDEFELDLGSIKAYRTEDNTNAPVDTDWDEVEVLSVVTNDVFVSITVAFTGDGSYALGIDETTSVIDVNLDTYDSVIMYDMLGREINRNSNLSDLPIGVYIKSYVKDGKVIKSEKIISN